MNNLNTVQLCCVVQLLGASCVRGSMRSRVCIVVVVVVVLVSVGGEDSAHVGG